MLPSQIGLESPQSRVPDASFVETPKPWYHKLKTIKMKDGSVHEGEPELITWSTVEDGISFGLGGVFLDESDVLKRKFEVEMKGDLKKLFKYHPGAFRWTFCGGTGDNHFGCDHHGRGKLLCKCDFCSMGKPLPPKIYNKLKASAGGKGLDLARGPDPRSKNPATGAIAERARAMLGLDG